MIDQLADSDIGNYWGYSLPLYTAFELDHRTGNLSYDSELDYKVKV